MELGNFVTNATKGKIPAYDDSMHPIACLGLHKTLLADKAYLTGSQKRQLLKYISECTYRIAHTEHINRYLATIPNK